MGGARQVGAVVFSFFVLFAFVAALSRLLKMQQLPGYISNFTGAVSNLFAGTFGQKK